MLWLADVEECRGFSAADWTVFTKTRTTAERGPRLVGEQGRLSYYRRESSARGPILTSAALQTDCLSRITKSSGRLAPTRLQ